MAFLLALVLLSLQVMPVNGTAVGQKTGVAMAEEGPADTSGITATGASLAVDPAVLISDVTVTEVTLTSITYHWSPVEGYPSYYLYSYDEMTQQYVFVGETDQTTFQLNDIPAGEQRYVTVCAVNAVLGCRSDFSVPVSAYTKPEKVESFVITDNTTTSVTLQWTDLSSATGYLIYRAGTGGNFKKIDTTQMNQYTDTTLDSGKTYQYKIVAYAGTTDNVGEESPAVFTCSLPEAPVLTIKGGNQRVRLTWAAITGATGYHVYFYQDGQYVLLTTLEGKASKKFLHTGLDNDVTCQYYVAAYRTYNDVTYESAPSNTGTVTTGEVGETSTQPKLYQTKSSFKKSDAYKKCTDFRKKVNYKKSFAMPGMINTNVAEFACTTMIPQGLTYAKSCFFMTAYDSKGEENSVVYVLDGTSRELLTTIILPNKSHAGGIAFDGKNLWITQAKTLRSIPYKAVSEAIENRDPYIELSSYGVEIDLPQQAATVTYYKKLLWVASYDELNPGYLVSYKITGKSTTPSLTPLNTISMPTRVQGIAFTSNGRLLVSRSCQTDATQRGYMHQLDVYKPNLKKAAKGVISLGKTRRVITMPTMNEEIAVSGSYLYTVFESVSFTKATMRMDRVCALPISFVTKLSK
jgi:fibronectin type 3 domain-containing protein